MKLRLFSPEDVRGKSVLVRVDFNVPMQKGQVTDTTRICAHLATLKALRDGGARVGLVSHLGRPKGTRNMEYSLSPVAKALEKLSGWPVSMVDDCVGPEVSRALASIPEGALLMLENVRFYPEEERNDAIFAKELAAPFDIFVMDAFSAAHRAHASTRGVADLLPAFAGELMRKELEALGTVRDHPKHPFVLILGGAKVSDKIGVIENMLGHVDSILVGGGMAFTFLKAQGKEIGKSLCETEKLDFAREMLDRAREKGIDLLLPEDAVVAPELKDGVLGAVVSTDAMPEGQMGLDIGPRTADRFAQALKSAQTVLWNGPMGVFEIPAFVEGSQKIARAMVEATARGALTVVGGGDSAAAIAQFGLEKGVSHVSTGGGASLEFFEGLPLPGVEPLLDPE
ncbi:MAG TPA: phosphoglycerate kinase [Synergistaceae bacterium]|nr:phosphoglycerate kinase [Synergistaceae bacterium]HQF91812.1 phosphoglycerate kinase [Synergistaceae bacterium]HQK25229.1 phosphoglycerate kinase [Synergistaceae bacterium]